MKKIGFVNFDMSTRGGAQQVLQNIANALCDKYEITVISFIHEKSECAYDLDDSIHYVNILPYKGRIRDVMLKAGKKFRSICRDQNLDMVFYVGAYAGLCGGFLGRTLKIPRVFCDHGALMNQWNEKPARIMRTVGSRYSDRTVVLTKQSEQAYYNKFSYKEGRVITIYNWMDDRILNSVCKYDKKALSILTAGRFSKEKGMDMLVDTAVRLKELIGDFSWDVYGEGDMFLDIQERIKRENLSDNVHLRGVTNEMEKCYGGHSMYVLTSYREGLPLVLLEAKANHLPLVSFDIVSGPSEIITDGEDGVLIPPYDTKMMAETIKDLLMDETKRVNMSEKSSMNVERFHKEKILKQWIALIEDLCS